ncbi:MAG: hypothetical protein FWF41_05365 [Betaproteobacteria bacterium]|nr:hypothetical protein [Betaproteobacteria bacterium]
MKRIYKITEAASGKTHFVRADNRAQAVRILTDAVYTTEVATTEDVVAAAAKGALIVLEDQPEPTDEPQTEEEAAQRMRKAALSVLRSEAADRFPDNIDVEE